MIIIIFRWRKFSHLEPSHTYLPAPSASRLSSLVSVAREPGPGTRANSLTLSSLGLLASGLEDRDRRKHSLMSAARSNTRDECKMHFQFLIMFKSLFC